MKCFCCEKEYKLNKFKRLKCCYNKICINCYKEGVDCYYEYNGFNKQGEYCKMSHTYFCAYCGYVENKKQVSSIKQKLEQLRLF